MTTMEDVFGPPISVYANEQAVEDGMLVEVFKNRWGQLTKGRPIYATRAVFEAFSLAALIEMWNDYVVLQRDGEYQLFMRGNDMNARLADDDPSHMITSMNGREVWLMPSGPGFTFMFPEDY